MASCGRDAEGVQCAHPAPVRPAQACLSCFGVGVEARRWRRRRDASITLRLWPLVRHLARRREAPPPLSRVTRLKRPASSRRHFCPRRADGGAGLRLRLRPALWAEGPGSGAPARAGELGVIQPSAPWPLALSKKIASAQRVEALPSSVWLGPTPTSGTWGCTPSLTAFRAASPADGSPLVLVSLARPTLLECSGGKKVGPTFQGT